MIQRTDRLPDSIPGLSRYHEVVLHQGRIERFFLDSLNEYSKIQVERGVLPEELSLDRANLEGPDAYPIKVKLQHLDNHEVMSAQNMTNIPHGLFRSNLTKDDTDDLLRRNKARQSSSETVRTKYLIGADGAHSSTRRQLGFIMEGEQTDFIWGVLDIIPITNFRMLTFSRVASTMLRGDSGHSHAVCDSQR